MSRNRLVHYCFVKLNATGMIGSSFAAYLTDTVNNSKDALC